MLPQSTRCRKSALRKIQTALERQLEEFFCRPAMELVSAWQLASEGAEWDNVRGRHKSAICNPFLECRDDLWGQIRAVQQIPQVLQKMRMPKDGVAQRSIFLEGTDARTAPSTDVEVGIGKNLRTSAIALRAGRDFIDGAQPRRLLASSRMGALKDVRFYMGAGMTRNQPFLSPEGHWQSG